MAIQQAQTKYLNSLKTIEFVSTYFGHLHDLISR